MKEYGGYIEFENYHGSMLHDGTIVFDGYKYTRNEVYEMLSEQGITARKYFYPLTNSFECYRNYPTAGTEKTPVAQHLALRVLTLPLYADLALEDVDRICDIILG